jgi:hypothetical protein
MTIAIEMTVNAAQTACLIVEEMNAIAEALPVKSLGSLAQQRLRR